MRVAALTPGLDVPSGRFRVRQFIPALAEHGVAVEEFVPRIPSHVLMGRGRPGAIAQAVRVRSRHVAATRGYDLTWLQRELVSTHSTLERLTGRPRVFDVDDAVYLGRSGKAAPAVAAIAGCSDMVVCGNPVLAEWFGRHSRRVEVVPTVVDTDAYRPTAEPDGDLVIGWMGTASNLANLEAIEAPLARALARQPGARLEVVSNAPPRFRALPADRWRFVPWSRDTEVAALQAFHIGLMPLEDTEWNRGKCGFKILQYMAMGRPVVASPVGVNRVLVHGAGGQAAESPDDWEEAVGSLLADPARRRRLGAAGRAFVEDRYSVASAAPRLARLFRELVD